MSAPLVSVYVISFFKFEATMRCLDSLRAHVRGPCEVVLVENCSATTEQRAVLDEMERVWPALRVVHLDARRHCPWIRARVLDHARGEHIFFLDNDCYLESDIFPPLLAELDRNPGVAGIAPGLLYHPERTYQCLGIEIEMEDERHFHPRHLRHGETHAAHRDLAPFPSDFIPGGCSLFRRSYLETCRYDENLKNLFGDYDLCLQGRAGGHGFMFHPGCSVLHDKSTNCGEYMQAKAQLSDWLGSVRYFEEKWGLRYFLLKHLDAGRVVLDHGRFPRWLPRAEWPENRGAANASADAS